ncbi:bacteriochlorophyll 4-vinyl reductase [Azohydromonas sediminis]|uniref:bacteriochlorophyll 4-vinyl reductase n=1 Tax=Azohydromonas sediminis TaxID=2259674 RepID=UPI000E6513F4|nr:bacteriochlorophyll 4-vinyl reductase [Azohydromonas sediminis]
MVAVLEHAAGARIGPNAITRVAEVLRERLGADGTARLFGLAGLAAYVERPPQVMVDEAEVTRLHAVLRATLGADVAAGVAREAGTRTGDYLLAHRIPKPAQVLLERLPAPLAAQVLLGAIRRHAWTFAGSGEFMAQPGRPVRLTIRDNPMCRGITSDVPVCDFYAATFERLFRALVHRRAEVVEVGCEACGDGACRFEVRW